VLPPLPHHIVYHATIHHLCKFQIGPGWALVSTNVSGFVDSAKVRVFLVFVLVTSKTRLDKVWKNDTATLTAAFVGGGGGSVYFLFSSSILDELCRSLPYFGHVPRMAQNLSFSARLSQYSRTQSGQSPPRQ